MPSSPAPTRMRCLPCFPASDARLPASTAFYKARLNIKDNYTRLSYVMLGTLRQYLNIKKDAVNIDEAKKKMVIRFATSIDRAFDLLKSGYIEKMDFDTLIKFNDIFDVFAKNNFPTEVYLRKTSTRIKNFIKNENDVSSTT